MAQEGINGRLETAVRERPLLAHLLDFRTVTRAVLAATIAALILWILLGAIAAAIVLLLVYFSAWYGLARLRYDRRRASRPA